MRAVTTTDITLGAARVEAVAAGATHEYEYWIDYKDAGGRTHKQRYSVTWVKDRTASGWDGGRSLLRRYVHL